MKDLIALRAMLDQDLYYRYSPVLSEIKTLEREHKQILNAIHQYYREYKEAKSINIDELKTYFAYLNPTTKSEVLDDIFNKLSEIKLDNPELIQDILNNVVERHTCNQIMQVSMAVMQDTKVTGIEEIEQLIEDYKNILGHTDRVEDDVYRPSFDELWDLREVKGLKWPLQFLQDAFGPLPRRILGHIFARPDGGKTTLAFQLACVFAYQQDDPILYLSNEEGTDRMLQRLQVCQLGKSPDQISENREWAEERWIKHGGDKIKLIGGVNYLNQVELYIRHFKPAVVFLDQGAKVSTPLANKMDGVERLKLLYNTYRELAKDYDCSIISLGQADSNSTNRKYLNLNNLDSSKVGIPGELDWALGIGKLDEDGYENIRYFNVCKNKLTGRRPKGQVVIDGDLCRFRD